MAVDLQHKYLNEAKKDITKIYDDLRLKKNFHILVYITIFQRF